MKVFFLVLLFQTLTICCFAQQKDGFKEDSITVKFNYNNLLNSPLKLNSLSNKYMSKSLNEVKGFSLKTKQIPIGNKSTNQYCKEQNWEYSMPCTKLYSKDKMPVIKCDSTMQHALLIKRFK